MHAMNCLAYTAYPAYTAFTLLSPLTLLTPLIHLCNNRTVMPLYIIWLYCFLGFRRKKMEWVMAGLDWMGDTHLTFMTTRAPAVLTNILTC